jgi:hypothetical protein
MYSDGDSGSVICFVADSRRSYVPIRAVRLRAMPTNRGSWRQRHTSSDDRYFLKYEALVSYPSV